MKSTWIQHGLLAICATWAMGGHAQSAFQKPEDAIKYRKAVLTVMGTHMGRMGAMAQDKIPFDAKAAQENAAIIESLAKLPWHAFVPGSETGGDTKAKPEIWKEAAKFNDSANKMTQEASKLAAATRGGKVDAFKTAFGALGKTCKECHDAFRTK